jgi:hypothetical protein
MKNVLSLFLLATLFYACTSTFDQPCALEPCEGNCLFTIENQIGMTKMIDCYGRQGIVYTNPQDSSMIILLPDEMPTNLMTDSIQVRVCGYARENTLPFLFPDPPGPLAYQFVIENIELE